MTSSPNSEHVLLNSFFEILESDSSPEKLISLIKLNAAHEIYKGHFPGNPVTPGVVQIQIVKELLETNFKKELKLKTMSRCKFLRVINPVETPTLTVTIEISIADNLVKVHATGQQDENVYFKLSAVYQ